MESRPELSSSLCGSDVRRWYWTMAELQPFARRLGLSAAGPKADLVDRIVARLDGLPSPSISSQTSSAGLTGDLYEATVIPHGQRSTQLLRTYFESKIGPSFRFDGHMRSFLATSDGSTLGDAVTHWYATRDVPLDHPPSLEFNRFVKEWHLAHPDGSPQASREAWARYRALPRDDRPPVAEA